MKKFLLIGAGGFLGAMLRYYMKNLDFNYSGIIPFNTLIINILGCFFIGIILTAAKERGKISENLKLALTTGFLGAFTTFSTLCSEISNLIYINQLVYALIYIFLSLGLGFLSVYFGAAAVRASFSTEAVEDAV